MAIIRNADKCPVCNKYMKAVYKKMPKNFVGDSFSHWEHDGVCQPSAEWGKMIREFKKQFNIHNNPICKFVNKLFHNREKQ